MSSPALNLTNEGSMHFTIIGSARSLLQSQHQQAFAQGLKKLGMNYTLAHTEHEAREKFAVCWGWRLGQRLRRRGFEVLVLERGYLGDRFSYTSMAWNGLNGHGRFPRLPSDGGKRFADLNVEIKPWKRSGDYTLILGQVPNDASLQGKNLNPWYEEITEKLKDLYKLPVHFRPHPEAVKRNRVYQVKGAVITKGSLQEDFNRAVLSVSYNSNSSVDSVMAGVPSIVFDRGSMAWDVCGHGLTEIIRPHRDEWAHNLAMKQWTVAEIASGVPVKYMIDDFLSRQ